MAPVRNKAVDMMKGLMILIIVIHHSSLAGSVLHHGYLAVDFFFFISGYYLMQSFSNKATSAIRYTAKRIKRFYLPFLIAFALACILDFRRLTSFDSFDGFVSLYAPFAYHLTLTEELGPAFQAPNILVGAWFISVLIIGGFLIYSVLEYSRHLATSIIFPLCFVFGVTFLFQQSNIIEQWERIGCIGLPLLRGSVGMMGGVLLYEWSRDLEDALRKYALWVNIACSAGFIILLAIMFTPSPNDVYSIPAIALLILGLVTPKSWAGQILHSLPISGLQTIGKLSFYIYIIHSPVLHIVHSLVKAGRISLPVIVLLLIDLVVVLGSAFLLRYLCHLIQCRNTHS